MTTPHPTAPPAPRHIVVVGAGIAGLVCAQRLQRAGARVTVLDRATPGGRALTQEQHGFSINLGPHALYRGGHAFRVLRSLGIAPDGTVATGGDGERLGRRSPLPDGLGTWLHTELLPGSSRYLMAPAVRAILFPPPGTLADAIASFSAPLRELTEALVRVSTYSADPTRMDAKVAFDQVKLAITGGVLYLHGGWQSLVTPLQAGLTIQRQAVTAVRPGRVSTADGEIEADDVVLAVPPATERSLTGQDPGETAEAAVATLCLGLSRLPVPEVPFVLGVDRPLYLSVHSGWARLAPVGGALVHVARYLREGEQGHAEELETWLDGHQPGWRDLVVFRRYLPRIRVAGHPAPGKARPGIVVAPGLWRCGDSVGDQGLLADAAFASGDAVADGILAQRQPPRASPNRPSRPRPGRSYPHFYDFYPYFRGCRARACAPDLSKGSRFPSSEV